MITNQHLIAGLLQGQNATYSGLEILLLAYVKYSLLTDTYINAILFM